MPPGEQVALQPALALVLAEHFHDTSCRRQELVARFCRGLPLAVGHLEEGLKAIGERLIRAEDPEVSLFGVELLDVAKERPQHVRIADAGGSRSRHVDCVVPEIRQVQIAEQKVKQTESDVQTQVRSSYFAHLSARKNFEISRALAELTDNVFNVLLLQLQAGEVAAYEPMQIRVLAMQSRGLLIQSYNRYVASWKQLSAALGTPNLALTDVAGQIDMPVPHFEHEAVLEYVLRNHTDVMSATLTQVSSARPVPA